ncbi:hypothetical protein Sango_2451900 [Sesamum angolense]|uniref:PWWP domain-containing protein n=1 Tax=Sesamum angolense TaxID=2727404 RepID=A0AAE1W830_9LAMI|nr:hypothetical protein Sango_2451900 [Sesamum angolense]
MECGEIKHLELALIDLFTRVKFGRSEAKRSRNGYLVYDSVASGTARFIKSSWIRMRGEIANRISAVLDTREKVNVVEKGRVLVAFFGDNTYGWLEPENVVPFEPHFDEKSKQSEDHLFLAAVEEALFEVKKRSALGLTCKCLNPSNFWPTEVQGFLEVDVAGYGARSKYSVEQIKKARNGFKPREMFSFLQKLALNPTIDTQNNFTLTRNVARVLAYRKSVFEEPDETYPQEFEAQAADNERHADVSYGKKKPHQGFQLSVKSHSEFSESAVALVIMGKHSPFVFTLNAINLYLTYCLVLSVFFQPVLNWKSLKVLHSILDPVIHLRLMISLNMLN